MRLPLQIAIGQAFVILFPIGLSLLAISVLMQVNRDVDGISLGNYHAAVAAEEVNKAMVRYEVARREKQLERLEQEKDHFKAAVKYLRESVKGERASGLIDSVNEKAESFFGGQMPLDDMLEVLSAVVDLQEDSILRGGAQIQQVSQSGSGLVAVLGALGLLTALLFGYWLTRTVGYPLERTVRTAEAIAGGNLHRRAEEENSNVAIDRLARAINQLADRLQRVESDRRLDFLLARAAVEKLLEERDQPAGLLTPGRRLIVANGEARRLVDEKRSSLDAIAVAASKEDPDAVERVSLEGPEGLGLGELVFLRRAAG